MLTDHPTLQRTIALHDDIVKRVSLQEIKVVDAMVTDYRLWMSRGSKEGMQIEQRLLAHTASIAALRALEDSVETEAKNEVKAAERGAQDAAA